MPGSEGWQGLRCLPPLVAFCLTQRLRRPAQLAFEVLSPLAVILLTFVLGFMVSERLHRTFQLHALMTRRVTSRQAWMITAGMHTTQFHECLRPLGRAMDDMLAAPWRHDGQHPQKTSHISAWVSQQSAQRHSGNASHIGGAGAAPGSGATGRDAAVDAGARLAEVALRAAQLPEVQAALEQCKWQPFLTEWFLWTMVDAKELPLGPAPLLSLDEYLVLAGMADAALTQEQGVELPGAIRTIKAALRQMMHDADPLAGLKPGWLALVPDSPQVARLLAHWRRAHALLDCVYLGAYASVEAAAAAAAEATAAGRRGGAACGGVVAPRRLWAVVEFHSGPDPGSGARYSIRMEPLSVPSTFTRTSPSECANCRADYWQYLLSGFSSLQAAVDAYVVGTPAEGGRGQQQQHQQQGPAGQMEQQQPAAQAADARLHPHARHVAGGHRRSMAEEAEAQAAAAAAAAGPGDAAAMPLQGRYSQWAVLFPRLPFVVNPYYEFSAPLAGLFFSSSLALPVAVFARSLVEERHSGWQHLLHTMGAPPWAWQLAAAAAQLPFMSASCAAAAVLASFTFLRASQASLLAVTLLAAGCAATGWGLLVGSALVRASPKAAMSATFSATFVAALPMFVFYGTAPLEHLAAKRASLLLWPCALGAFLQRQALGQTSHGYGTSLGGAAPELRWSGAGQGPLSTLELIGFLLMDAVLYVALALVSEAWAGGGIGVGWPCSGGGRPRARRGGWQAGKPQALAGEEVELAALLGGAEGEGTGSGGAPQDVAAAAAAASNSAALLVSGISHTYGGGGGGHGFMAPARALAAAWRPARGRPNGRAGASGAVLQCVTLGIAPGEALALLGRNGAGKSTTVAAAAGRLRPNLGGDVWYSGSRIYGGRPTPPTRLQRRLGLCPQQLTLAGDMSAEEHVRLAVTLRRVAGGPAGGEGGGSTRTTSVAREAQQLADLVALPFDMLQTRSRHLSGGSQRKLQLALALAGRPAVLILDEPTAGVDAASRHAIWAALQAIKRGWAGAAGRGSEDAPGCALQQRPPAMLFTTHHLDEVAALADNVAVLQQGRLACTTPGRVLQQRVLQQLAVLRVSTRPCAAASAPGAPHSEPPPHTAAASAGAGRGAGSAPPPSLYASPAHVITQAALRSLLLPPSQHHHGDAQAHLMYSNATEAAVCLLQCGKQLLQRHGSASGGGGVHSSGGGDGSAADTPAQQALQRVLDRLAELQAAGSITGSSGMITGSNDMITGSSGMKGAGSANGSPAGPSWGGIAPHQPHAWGLDAKHLTNPPVLPAAAPGADGGHGGSGEDGALQLRVTGYSLAAPSLEDLLDLPPHIAWAAAAGQPGGGADPKPAAGARDASSSDIHRQPPTFAHGQRSDASTPAQHAEGSSEAAGGGDGDAAGADSGGAVPPPRLRGAWTRSGALAAMAAKHGSCLARTWPTLALVVALPALAVCLGVAALHVKPSSMGPRVPLELGWLGQTAPVPLMAPSLDSREAVLGLPPLHGARRGGARGMEDPLVRQWHAKGLVQGMAQTHGVARRPHSGGEAVEEAADGGRVPAFGLVPARVDGAVGSEAMSRWIEQLAHDWQVVQRSAKVERWEGHGNGSSSGSGRGGRARMLGANASRAARAGHPISGSTAPVHSPAQRSAAASSANAGARRARPQQGGVVVGDPIVQSDMAQTRHEMVCRAALAVVALMADGSLPEVSAEGLFTQPAVPPLSARHPGNPSCVRHGRCLPFTFLRNQILAMCQDIAGPQAFGRRLHRQIYMHEVLSVIAYFRRAFSKPTIAPKTQGHSSRSTSETRAEGAKAAGSRRELAAADATAAPGADEQRRRLLGRRMPNSSSAVLRLCQVQLSGSQIIFSQLAAAQQRQGRGRGRRLLMRYFPSTQEMLHLMAASLPAHPHYCRLARLMGGKADTLEQVYHRYQARQRLPIISLMFNMSTPHGLPAVANYLANTLLVAANQSHSSGNNGSSGGMHPRQLHQEQQQHNEEEEAEEVEGPSNPFVSPPGQHLPLASGSQPVQAYSHPLPPVGGQGRAVLDMFLHLLLALMVGLPITYMAGLYVVRPVDEAANGAKWQQLVSGCPAATLWAAQWAADMAVHTASCTAVVGLLWLSGSGTYAGSASRAGSVMALLVLWGAAGLPWAYLIASTTRHASAAQARVSSACLVCGLGAAIARQVLSRILAWNWLANRLLPLMRLLPPFCLVDGLLQLCFYTAVMQLRDSFVGSLRKGLVQGLMVGQMVGIDLDNPSALQWNVMGAAMAYLALDALLYGGLLLALEAWRARRAGAVATGSSTTTNTAARLRAPRALARLLALAGWRLPEAHSAKTTAKQQRRRKASVDGDGRMRDAGGLLGRPMTDDHSSVVQAQGWGLPASGPAPGQLQELQGQQGLPWAPGGRVAPRGGGEEDPPLELSTLLPDTERLERPPPALQVDGLCKVFGSGKCVVSGVSFELRAGQCMALLGGNGAGKSTLMAMLSGQLSPSGGRVLVGGVDMAAQTAAARRRVAHCPQTDPLLPYLTPLEHLALYCMVRNQRATSGRGGAVSRGLVALALACGLGPTQWATPAGALSGGNKRKLCLAQALLGRPLVVLLDEPSTGMDGEARRAMWDAVSMVLLGQQRGRQPGEQQQWPQGQWGAAGGGDPGEAGLPLQPPAVLLTTHRTDEALALGDVVGVLVQGHLAAFGPAAEVLPQVPSLMPGTLAGAGGGGWGAAVATA